METRVLAVVVAGRVVKYMTVFVQCFGKRFLWETIKSDLHNFGVFGELFGVQCEAKEEIYVLMDTQ